VDGAIHVWTDRAIGIHLTGELPGLDRHQFEQLRMLDVEHTGFTGNLLLGG